MAGPLLPANNLLSTSPLAPLTLLTLPRELLLLILPYIHPSSLSTLSATCSFLRSLRPTYILLLRRLSLHGHKICTSCIRLRPHTDFPWHAPSHTSELCLRHLDFWVCDRKSCDLRYFAFKWNRRELEVRLLKRWRVVREGGKTGWIGGAFAARTTGETSGSATNENAGEGASQLPKDGRIQGPQQSAAEQAQAESEWAVESQRACRWSIAAMVDEHLAELFMHTDFSHFRNR